MKERLRGGEVVKKLVQLKKEYYNNLDSKARYTANLLKHHKMITKLLLDYISDLYDSANTEKAFSNSHFLSAYHQPITADLEFLLARILFYYSKFKKLNWTVNLRKQKKDPTTGKNVAPDIKIERAGKIIAIIEIKANAGWIQPFFSEKRELKDKGSGRNPEEEIKKAKKQLMKYANLDGCNKNKVFVFLPTFVHVHRKKYNDNAESYRNTFVKNSTLKKDNLIILSNNPSLDLSSSNKSKDYRPTENFENFIKKLERM